ncbi:MAG: phage holin family protein [Chloroflexota bacterium]|nr:MAG: phage holin family protein [Chloroflexota bacterium]
MGLLIRFAITFAAAFVAAYVFPASFQYDNVASLLVFSLVLGVLNAIVKPVVVMLTCPIQLLTLGLAVFLVNTGLFLVAANLVPGIRVADFGAAFIASLTVTMVSWGLHALLRK